MGNDLYDSDYYEEEESSGGLSRQAVIILGIVGALLLIVSALCLILTLKIRSARKTEQELRNQLTVAQSQTQGWSYPDVSQTQPVVNPIVPETTIPEGGENENPVPESTEPVPEATPEPTPEPTPIPTPTPAPVITEPGGVPSWISEDNMAKITVRPKDDEWYSAPGKLYVSADLALNMRSGPDSSYNLIFSIPKDEEVTVYASHDNWRFVQDQNGHFGWVSNNMLTNEPPAGAVVSETPTPEAPVVIG